MMEMMNTALKTPAITAETTLGEVLAMLNLGEKPKIPTPKVLFETAGEPIADMNDCTLFSNGFVVYKNRSGRTVVWLPYCTSFTFYFNKLRDSEKTTLQETYDLPEGFLETQPWILAVSLIGDHRIEQNCMNRTGSRAGTSDYSSQDNGDKNGTMAAIAADPYCQAFSWYDGHMGENPQDAVERRETRDKMLASIHMRFAVLGFPQYFGNGRLFILWLCMSVVWAFHTLFCHCYHLGYSVRKQHCLILSGRR